MNFADRVMQLCTQALDAEDEKQTREILLELRELLHQRIEQLRGDVAEIHSTSRLKRKNDEKVSPSKK